MAAASEGGDADIGVQKRRRGRPRKSDTQNDPAVVGSSRLGSQGGVAGSSDAAISGEVNAGPSTSSLPRKPRELRSDRAMAQWIAAEKKGRIKIVVAASELEYALAKSTVLDTVDGEEEVQAAFNTFDVDGSGAIDADELQQGMRALGVDTPAQEMEQLFADVDTDGSGEIDMHEFRDMMTARPHVVINYQDLHTALEDRPPSALPVTAATIDLTLSGNDLLADTLAVLLRVQAAHRDSLELLIIKSRAVHELAMQVFLRRRRCHRHRHRCCCCCRRRRHHHHNHHHCTHQYL